MPVEMNVEQLELFSGRRSIRRYRNDPVPREILEQLLTAAIWAPSAHNRQPWRFVIIAGRSMKEKLARASQKLIGTSAKTSISSILNAPPNWPGPWVRSCGLI